MPTANAAASSSLRNGRSLVPVNGRNTVHMDDPDVLDMICVGFGPASLAVAIALHDALELAGKSDLQALDGRNPTFSFLERQPQFSWHPGMLLEGAKMQITFIKDMASLRNPRSKFTFLNYLHEKGRLIQFSNLGTFLPQRTEFQDYLQWCASFFQDHVRYNQEVISVKGVHDDKEDICFKHYVVESKDLITGFKTRRQARHIVIAIGGSPNIPIAFQPGDELDVDFFKSGKVLHSSAYATRINRVLRNRDAAYRIAVVGAGQSAAEIFEDLHAKFPNSSTHLIFRGSALRPSDDSPFVNEIFDPSRVSPFYQKSQSDRQRINFSNRQTNYTVVRLELIERIYSMMYHQRIKYGNDEHKWLHRIVPNTSVCSAKPVAEGTSVQLALVNHECADAHNATRSENYDLVILATGYIHDGFKRLLDVNSGCDSSKSRCQAGKESYEVGRDYSLKWHDHRNKNCGIWLQGCNEETHGLADTLLSILSVRAGELVSSMFGRANERGPLENGE